MRARFNWQDPFLLMEQLTDGERAVQETARQFCQSKLEPHFTKTLQAGFDPSIFKEFGAIGFFGCTIKGYGCADLNHVSYGLIARELERVDAGFRGMMSVQASLVMHSIYYFGSEMQKSTYLPKLASGELIGCFGMTEPEHGSNPGGMETRAVSVPGGYRITGHKMWISFSPIADLFIIWAKLDAFGTGSNAVRGFILHRGAAGLSTRKIDDKVGLPNSITGEVMLNDVFVPEENLLAGAKGLSEPLDALTSARYGIAWGALGSAEDCWQRTLQYTLERKPFGKPLAGTQLVQKNLADMQTEIAIGLQSCLRVGRLIDEQKATSEMISLVKRNSCGKALGIARAARDMHGGNGLRGSYRIMYHMMNLEADNTYEGTHDIHALVLGRAQTGLQAFY